MKKLIFFLLLFIAVAAVQAQQADNLKSKSYQMNFVFTGEVKNLTDSTFALEYSLSEENVRNYRALVLETSKDLRRVDLSGKNKAEGMEIKTEKGRVKVIIHHYDKYDIPVLTQAEGTGGTAHPLYLHGRGGGYMTAGQLKAQVKQIREAMGHQSGGEIKQGETQKKE